MLIKNFKNRIIEYFLVFLMIISSSSVSSALGTSYTFYFISAFITLVYFLRLNLRFDNDLVVILTFYTIYMLLQFIIFPTFYPGFLARILWGVGYAYLFLKIFKLDFISIFIDITFILTLLSLFLYPIQLFYFDNLFNIIASIQNSIPFLFEASSIETNILIYNLEGSFSAYRNSGFMWEPGAYAAILLISIFFNSIIKNFKIDIKTIIFILALLTTLSTMGYIGLFLIIMWIIYNKGKLNRWVLYPVLILSFIALYENTTFLENKINFQINDADDAILTAFSGPYSYYSLGRFGSAIMDINDLAASPIIGIGGEEGAKTDISYKTINRTNGVTKFLLLFGILGFIILITNLILSGNHLSRKYKFKGAVFFLILVLIVCFSNDLLLTPLFWSFQLIHFLIPIAYTQNSNIINEH